MHAVWQHGADRHPHYGDQSGWHPSRADELLHLPERTGDEEASEAKERTVNQTVLRRKLQKKKKHKPYRKCPKCGNRMDCFLFEGDHDGWHLFKVCGSLNFVDAYHAAENVQGKPRRFLDGTVLGCGHSEELHWSGGGIGRHIPHGQPAGDRGLPRAGSNPASTVQRNP